MDRAALAVPCTDREIRKSGDCNHSWSPTFGRTLQPVFHPQYPKDPEDLVEMRLD